MLKEAVQTALNAQINMEFGAFYTYLSMAAYFEDEALPGFAAWTRHHAEEEMVHAMRIYDYIIRRRGRVQLQALKEPTTSWADTLAAIEDAMRHEQKVTGSINALVDLARSENDPATESFLQWFVDEQVEEEEVVDKVLQQLKRVGDFAPGLFLLDRDLSAEAGGEASAEAGGEAT
jgi:ferritin